MARTDIEIVADASATTPSDQGFIRVRRWTLRTHFPDGSSTQPYRYDVADRSALDAVVMLLHAPREGVPMDPWVCLRTALRPPLISRRNRPGLETPAEPMLWELPAGLIEPGDHGEAGVYATAARETEEEVGYTLAPEAFVRLGAPVFLSPGLLAERIHIVHAAVDRSATCRPTATEVVEAHARVEWWTLSDALQRAAEGVIEDAKTELGLLRFRALIQPSHP